MPFTNHPANNPLKETSMENQDKPYKVYEVELWLQMTNDTVYLFKCPNLEEAWDYLSRISTGPSEWREWFAAEIVDLNEADAEKLWWPSTYQILRTEYDEGKLDIEDYLEER